MYEVLEMVNEIILQFLIFIVIGISGLVGEIIRRKYNEGKLDKKEFREKLEVMQNCLNTQNDRGIRQSKSQIDIVEYLESETERLHPEQTVTKIKDRITRNLKDEEGNF